MKTLIALSALLARSTPLFISLVAGVTFLVPDLFAWVRGDVQTLVLGLIMLTMGMTLKTDDFKALGAHPWHIGVGTVAQFVIMPGVAWALVHLLGLPKALAVGLLLVGCCPGGVSSNIMCYLCKGDVAFSLGITIVSTVLAPVMTPLLMLFLAGETVEVDALGMFRSILLVTILPVAVGTALNTTLGRRAGYVEAMKVMPGVSVLALACIVGGVVSAQGTNFFRGGLWIFLAVFLHNALGYVMGYASGVLARFTEPRRRSVALEVGMQNAGLATVLAARHFPLLPEAAVAAAVSCVWHSVTGALTAGIFNAVDRLLRRELGNPHQEYASLRGEGVRIGRKARG